MKTSEDIQASIEKAFMDAGFTPRVLHTAVDIDEDTYHQFTTMVVGREAQSIFNICVPVGTMDLSEAFEDPICFQGAITWSKGKGPSDDFSHAHDQAYDLIQA